MTLAEYLVGLFTIVTGLALTDMVQRVAALIEHRREIKWDWLPLLFAALAVLTLVTTWALSWQTIRRAPEEITLARFLFSLSVYVVIYLLSAATLPRDPRPKLDLRKHFERQSRVFWLLYALLAVYFGLAFVYLPALSGRAALTAYAVALNVVSIGVSVSLMFTARRMLHLAGAMAILAVLASNLTTRFGATLNAIAN
jgi:hypothetical protein